ncbi:MAG: acyl-CoA dehydrogenase family protein [Candidatus Binatia bacterium]
MPRNTPIDFDSSKPSSPFYNDSHREWRDSLRRWLAREVAPWVNEWEEAGEIPLSLYKKASEFGLSRLGYPEEYGGLSSGFDHFHHIISSEETAQMGAGGIFASLMVHGIGLPPILALGSTEMKERVAPAVLSGDRKICLGITEPGAGSDVASIETRATREGDEFVVRGSKMFITGGLRADYMTTAVRTGGPGMGGISLLLIEMDRPGVSRTKLDKMGWWASDTAAVYLDEVRVPAGNLIGPENQGFLGIVLNFNSERLGMASSANGYARTCLVEAARYAQQRQTFGKRLADHQVIRHKIAEMLRQVNATQAYLENCAWRVQQGETPAADLALLKVQATLTMEFCAREAMQVLGGAGYLRGNKVERIYREVRVNAIGGGSEEIMRDLAARQIGL